MLAVAVSARALTADPRIEVTLSPRLRTSPLPVTPAGPTDGGTSGNVRTPPCITHYRSKRCYESHATKHKARYQTQRGGPTHDSRQLLPSAPVGMSGSG